MATSYTSLLGLALPVTGELAGTWGDTVNNAITSLLDTAVAGTTTLSTDADVTLTTTTGATNQARQAILLCSGARTALRTITAPAQSKIYVVINSTTGGFGVKLVGVGPTTGVTVANGKTAVLVWNGSDFVEVAPATATTATNLAGGLAGSVPYQTGSGATTFLAIGTNNYVLTSNGTAPLWSANTGTGNVVRASSPTLTTPTLGVASATSINKVAITAPATGSTLTIADGKTLTASNTLTFTGTDGSSVAFGTGGTVTYTSNNLSVFASTTSAQLAGVISDETGSGALVFGTSPTIATPTITTSATVPLVIGGTGTTSTLSLRSTSGVGTTGADIIFQVGNNGATEAMRILNSGNVGIAQNTPVQKLDVTGNIRITGYITDGGNNIAIYPSSGGSLALVSNSAYTNGNIRYDALAAAGIHQWQINTSEQMRLNTTGLGIGTSTTLGKLTVNGSGNFPLCVDSNSLYAEIQTYNSAPLRINRQGNDVLIGSGNVGIGTATPTATLDVRGSMFVIGAGGTRVTDTVAGNGFEVVPSTTNNILSYNRTTAAYLPIRWRAGIQSWEVDNVERMRLDSSGNLGLGVTPSAWGTLKALELGGSGGTYIAAAGVVLYLGANNYYNGTNYIYKTTGAASNYQQIAGAHNWLVAGSGTAGTAISFSQAMTLSSSGNLGIGNTSPSQKLDVNGIARFTDPVASRDMLIAASTTGAVHRFYSSNTSAGYAFENNTTELMRLTALGDLGVGTAPATRLHVYSASSLISRTQSATTGYAVGNYVNSSGNFYIGIDSSTAGGFAVGNYSRLIYSDGAYPIVIATNSNERMRIDSAGNVGIGTTSPVNKLQINGSLGRNAPVTKTGNFTLADTENWLICNGTGTITVTFPAASSWTGREVMIKTIAAFTVVSASSNVVPLAGGAAGTAILAATAGAWATLVSDGTNWIIMQA